MVSQFSSHGNLGRCIDCQFEENIIDLLNGPRELSGNPNMLTLKSTPFPSGLDVPATYPRIVLFLESGKIA